MSDFFGYKFKDIEYKNKIINEMYEYVIERLETLFLYDEQNITLREILIKYFNSSRFQIINEETYYSSYISETDLSVKNYIWLSSDMGQSITYPFEQFQFESSTDVLNPYMYQINIDTPLKLLISDDVFNSQIFINEDDLERIDIFYNLNTKYFPRDNEKHFRFENNFKILLFIELFNKIIDKLNESLEQSKYITNIDGYKNTFDQDEVALYNFNVFYNPDNIITYRLTNITYDDGIEKHSIDIPYNNSIGIDKAMTIQNIRYIYVKGRRFSSKLKMICNEHIKIRYINIITDEEFIYECSDKNDVKIKGIVDLQQLKMKKDTNYQKYIKYKSKYIQLMATRAKWVNSFMNIDHGVR